jgi:hypothetical protein
VTPKGSRTVQQSTVPKDLHEAISNDSNPKGGNRKISP